MINLYNKHKSVIWVLSLFTTIFATIAVFYLISNTVLVYDAAAHLGIIENLKTNLLPFTGGWNSDSLVGFDQGVFYPSLFHWIAALLGTIIGVKASVEFLVGLSLIILPATIYCWANSFKVKKDFSFILLLGLALIVLSLPGYLGANLKALTKIGLLTSFVSLPLIFVYLASLNKIKNWGVVPAALLLSSLLLTHLVAGIFAFLCLITYFFVDWSEEKGVNLKTYGAIVLLTVLLTSFYWVPFFLEATKNLSISAHPISLLLPNVIGLILGVFFFRKYWKKERQLSSLALVVVVLSASFLIDNFTNRFLTGAVFEKIYSLHLYRFQIYSFYLIAFLVLYSLRDLVKINLKPTNYKLLVLLVIFLTGVYLIINSAFVNIARVEFVKNLPKIEGRFLEIFRHTESYPHNYSLQNQLVVEKGLPWAYGLFTDATPNGPYIGSLIKSLRPEAYSRLDQRFIENRLASKDRIVSYLDLFGVTNLLYLDNQPAGCLPIATTEINGEKKIFHLQPRQLQGLVAVPTQTVSFKPRHWESEVEKWWFKKGGLDELLVYQPAGAAQIPKFTQRANTSANIIENNKNWTKFRVKIDSTTTVPTLIKFGYSPRWQAFQNNREVKIYRASPNLMMIFASGEVDFRYNRLWYQDFSLGLSLLVFFGVVIYLIKKVVDERASQTFRR